ncbi:MAG: glycosyltransferase family 39 protein [Acidobacteriota bacterium]
MTPIKEGAGPPHFRRPAAAPGAWRWREALPPAAAGLLARLLLIAWTSPLELSLDEARFWDLATRRMHGTAFLPPLYPLYLAAVRSAVGDSVTVVRVIGACVSLAGLLLVHRLAERRLGPRAAVVSAWVAALAPTLVYYDGRIRSESLFILLLLLSARLFPAAAAGRPAQSLGAGCLLGLALLLRPEFLLLPFLLGAVAIGRGGSAALRGAAPLCAGLLLVLAPWAARNRLVVGVWAPVSTNGGYNFWKSFNDMTDGSQIPVADYSLWDGVDEREMDRVGYREGWRYVRARPVRSVLLVPAKWAHLFGPERDFLSDVRRRRFPRRALWVDLGFGLAQNLSWLLILSLGLLALIGPARDSCKDFTVAFLANLLLIHAVFFGDGRFHVPLIPLLCVALPEAWDGSRRPARRLALLGLALILEVSCWAAILLRDRARIGSIWSP